MPYPRTPLLDSPPLVRIGLPEYVQRPSPAAAAAFQENIPGDYFARFLTVFFRLVTDATVANRTAAIEYRDHEDNRMVLAGAPVTQSASSTNDYAFTAWLGQPDWSVISTILVPIPPLLLLPTFDMRIVIDGVQAGDQLSRIRFMWERFYTTDQPDVALAEAFA